MEKEENQTFGFEILVGEKLGAEGGKGWEAV